MARNRFSNTEIKIVEYDQNGKYTDHDKTDPNAGVFWFVNDKGPLMFWSNSGVLGSIDPVKPIHQLKSRTIKVEVGDIYRTRQHPPLVGRFLGKNCELTAILKRGEDFEKADAGAGYVGKVILQLVATDQACGDKRQIIAQATEDDEQLSVASLEDGHDVLVTLRKEYPDRLDSAIWLRVFDLTGTNSDHEVPAVTIPVPLANDKCNNTDWLRIPPLLVAPKDKPASSLLFFTRFVSKSESTPHYDFIYYRLKDLRITS